MYQILVLSLSHFNHHNNYEVVLTSTLVLKRLKHWEFEDFKLTRIKLKLEHRQMVPSAHTSSVTDTALVTDSRAPQEGGQILAHRKTTQSRWTNVCKPECCSQSSIISPCSCFFLSYLLVIEAVFWISYNYPHLYLLYMFIHSQTHSSVHSPNSRFH